jgi:hypothetical protein
MVSTSSHCSTSQRSNDGGWAFQYAVLKSVHFLIALAGEADARMGQVYSLSNGVVIDRALGCAGFSGSH